jgi:hypothetical protein
MALAPVPGGTRLVFDDELTGDIAARNAAGWEVCLDRLAGTPVDEPPCQARSAASVADFEGRLGLRQGPPRALLEVDRSPYTAWRRAGKAGRHLVAAREVPTW